MAMSAIIVFELSDIQIYAVLWEHEPQAFSSSPKLSQVFL